MSFEYKYEIDTERSKIAYIYALVEPESLRARYVGMTDAPNLRYRLHHSNGLKKHYATGKPEDRQLYLWFREVLQKGTRPRMLILSEVPLQRAKIEERHFIGLLRTSGEPIFNRDKSLFEMQAIANQFDGQCTSHEYIRSTHALNWRCVAGHEFLLTAQRVLRGVWCPTCSKLIALQQNRLVREVYEDNRALLECKMSWIFQLS